MSAELTFNILINYCILSFTALSIPLVHYRMLTYSVSIRISIDAYLQCKHLDEYEYD